MTDEQELIAAENQRLLKEVRQLRARVAALESSRWWRLHPRFALRRLFPARARSEVATEPPRAEPRASAADDLVAHFRTEVMAHGSFSHDWFTEHIAGWVPLLQTLEGRPSNILELGSFEGLSACFVLWRLPEAHLTCVDTFGGSPEHAAMEVDHSQLEEVFDRNIALVDGRRVRKIVGESVDALLELGRSGERFDLVYVDASHLALDVIVDAALAWPLLVPGGVLVFDDYEWRSPLGEDPLLLPGPAVDAFLALVGRHCEVLAKGAQAIVRKTASAAEPVADRARETANASGA